MCQPKTFGIIKALKYITWCSEILFSIKKFIRVIHSQIADAERLTFPSVTWGRCIKSNVQCKDGSQAGSHHTGGLNPHFQDRQSCKMHGANPQLNRLCLGSRSKPHNPREGVQAGRSQGWANDLAGTLSKKHTSKMEARASVQSEA